MTEQLTPQEQVQDHIRQAHDGPARDLANKANEAFANRHTAALALAGTVSVEGSAHQAEAAFSQADNNFGLYNKAAETLMPARSAFEVAEPTEPFASETVWQAMTREQQVKVTEARTAIATSKLKEHGVTEDTLRLVMTEIDGNKQFTLIHTGKGVDIGDPKKDYDKARSYNSVMSKKNDDLFKVTVGGVTYDTRDGMTSAVYDAKVEDARARNVTLPDSKQLSQDTGDDWTWTMLTGDELTADGLVPFRDVSVGGVRRVAARPVDGDRVLRVCPAVVIE